MWILWDLLSVLVILFCVQSGTKKGFVRTLISLLSYVVAAVLGRMWAPQIASWLYSNYFSDAITRILVEKLGVAAQQGMQNLPEILLLFPPWLAGMAGTAFPEFGTSPIDMNLQGLTEQQIGTAAQAIQSALAQPVIQLLSGMILLVLFLLLVLLIKSLARIFTGINRLPVVGSINMFFGGFLGVAQSIVILFILSIIVAIVGTVTGNQITFLNEPTMKSSLIMGSLYRYFL